MYYKGSNSKIDHKSMVIFSDNLIYDAVAVYLIQEIKLKQRLDSANKTVPETRPLFSISNY